MTAWTDAEIATLCDRWGSEPARFIADSLGKTHCAVIGKAYRLQLPRIDEETRCRWIRQGYARTMGRGI